MRSQDWLSPHIVVLDCKLSCILPVVMLSYKLQAQGNIQAQQNLALTLRLQSLQTQLQAVKGHSSSSQSQAEEQQGLLLAAQRKLYTQQSRLIDSVELLRREVESLAVEQTLQVSLCIETLLPGLDPAVASLDYSSDATEPQSRPLMCSTAR